MVLEAINEQVDEAMCKLLRSLSNAVIITPDMMDRVSTMSSISLEIVLHVKRNFLTELIRNLRIHISYCGITVPLRTWKILHRR